MNPLVSIVTVTFNRKDEVIECIDSVLKSTYQPFEVIVIDNASFDGTIEALKSRFANKIRLIGSKINLFAGGGRNLGAKYAHGDFILFIDSDNVIESKMIENLASGLEKNNDLRIGMCGPFAYFKSEPNRLTWVNNRINLITSITSFKGAGEIDHGQYDNLSFIEVDHIPNVFMVKRDLFNSVGGFDQDYVMHYEESDLAEKIKRNGLKIVLFPQAKCWHVVSMVRERGHKSFKGQNPAMVYYVTRNRIYFMRKNSAGLRLFLFLLIFSNIFLIYNILILIFNRKLVLINLALRGYLEGIFSSLSKARG